MIKFVNNNILFSIIFLIFFFMNKSLHSHMSFNSDIIKYESIRERLQINWVKNIFEQMNKTLLRVYQDWMRLVNDLVEIWPKFDSDLTQIWFNLFFFLNTLFFYQHLVHLHHILFVSQTHLFQV